MRDIKAAIERNETRESPAWQMLVDRLKDAIDRFTGGDPELRTAVELVMADQRNWPGADISVKFREFFTEAIAAAVVTGQSLARSRLHELPDPSMKRAGRFAPGPVLTSYFLLLTSTMRSHSCSRSCCTCSTRHCES